MAVKKKVTKKTPKNPIEKKAPRKDFSSLSIEELCVMLKLGKDPLFFDFVDACLANGLQMYIVSSGNK